MSPANGRKWIANLLFNFYSPDGETQKAGIKSNCHLPAGLLLEFDLRKNGVWVIQNGGKCKGTFALVPILSEQIHSINKY